MVVVRAKCVLLGDSTVGKSAVTQVFHSDGTMFPKNYTMSTGVEVCQKIVPVEEKGDSVDIFLFDSAGKEVFSEMCEKHWEDVGMVVIVFDVTDIETLNTSKKWLNKVSRFWNKEKTIPRILIGNKTDLEQRRQVGTEEGMEVAEQLSMKYFECSAKANEGVEAPFQWLAEKFIEAFNDTPDKVQLLE